MKRKLLTFAVLGAMSLTALVAVGCSSTATEPYSLTGKSQSRVDQDHQRWLEKQRYTDQKGRYHPELEARNSPLN